MLDLLMKSVLKEYKLTLFSYLLSLKILIESIEKMERARNKIENFAKKMINKNPLKNISPFCIRLYDSTLCFTSLGELYSKIFLNDLYNLFFLKDSLTISEYSINNMIIISPPINREVYKGKFQKKPIIRPKSTGIVINNHKQPSNKSYFMRTKLNTIDITNSKNANPPKSILTFFSYFYGECYLLNSITAYPSYTPIKLGISLFNLSYILDFLRPKRIHHLIQDIG